MKIHTTLRVKVLALLLLWFGFVGASNAAFSEGDGNYVGYMGLLDPAPASITTAWISSGMADSAFYDNYAAAWISSPVTHLYNFSLAQGLELDLYMEFRAADPMTITFYDAASNPVHTETVSFGGINIQDTYAHNQMLTLPAGVAWMEVEIAPWISGGNPDYDYGQYEIQLAGLPATVVPLPPALLLFGSTLIGFFTLGWRWRV